MKKVFLSFVLALCALTSFASPVTTPHATVSLLSEYQNVKAGQDFWVAFKIHTKPGWHVYWQNPGDSGMAPQLQWDLPKGFTAEPIRWLPPKRFQVAKLMNYGYEGDAYFLVKMKNQANAAAGEQILRTQANWLICNEDCVPESASLQLRVNLADDCVISDDNGEISAALDRLSAIGTLKGSGSFNERKISLRIPKAKLNQGKIESMYFFPREEGYVVAADVQKWDDGGDDIELRLSRDFATPQGALHGLLEVKTDLYTDYYRVKVDMTGNGGSDPVDDGLLAILLMAFLGGIILNAMPCVFPVLSLKALAIAKKAHSKPKTVRMHSIAYTAGVVLSFLTLAMSLIGLKYAGHAIGWGYQLQSPNFVVLLIFILFMVGLNLSGLFEIQWMFAGGAIADRSDWLGSFMTGVLATLVATPCTAPFMATAVGYALTQAGAHTLLVFASLGLGLASPFLLISFFPAMIKWLPKPGNWMVTLRQLLAFPIYLTCVWLIWVLAQQVSNNEVAAVLASLVFITMFFWLDGAVKRKGSAAHWLGRIVLVLLILFPFYCFKVFQDDVQEVAYSQEKLQLLQSQGKPVFVHATAAWCITCKANELLVLSKQSVRQAFRDNGITVMKADWTNQDQAITKYLEQFNRSGVPLYVFYPKKGEPFVLPQILTKSIVLEAIKKA